MQVGSASVVDPYQMFGATSSRLASSGEVITCFLTIEMIRVILSSLDSDINFSRARSQRGELDGAEKNLLTPIRSFYILLLVYIIRIVFPARPSTARALTVV